MSPGQAVISFNIENGKRIAVRSNIKKRRHRYDPDIHKFRYSRRINEEYPFEYGNKIVLRVTLNLLSLLLGEIVKAVLQPTISLSVPEDLELSLLCSQVIMV